MRTKVARGASVIFLESKNMQKCFLVKDILKKLYWYLCKVLNPASGKKTAMNNIQLSIPTPCHENWSSMQPNLDGRFCNACAKSVVDFTSMSDAQLVSYFSKPANGNICGRANSGQLERILQAPARPRKKIFFYNRVRFIP